MSKGHGCKFVIFFPENRFDISCKLSPMETICMKCQNLFSRKNKKIFLKCHLLKFLTIHQHFFAGFVSLFFVGKDDDDDDVLNHKGHLCHSGSDFLSCLFHNLLQRDFQWQQQI